MVGEFVVIYAAARGSVEGAMGYDPQAKELCFLPHVHDRRCNYTLLLVQGMPGIMILGCS